MRFLCLILCFLKSSLAFGAEPKPWQVYFQEPATEVMEDIVSLHNFILVIITAILLVVAGLLAYVCYFFYHKRNPVPRKFTHNVTVEIVWTIIPVIILCIIAVPSFYILHKQETIPKADMTIKVTGFQWYWQYKYQDYGDMVFDSYMIDEKNLKPGQKRLLDVDNRIVIPRDTVVRFLISAADVIHSFTVPSFGFKVDAVPGRVNETYVKVKKTGIYYGQCSEICGVNHGFMPIVVEVVSKEDFEKWVEASKQKYSSKYIYKPQFSLR
ncbi:MAG: cytochrome c oxidase subunit II [Rickettsiaceae bacterium]|nr:cytochrome c oxidase subunit II [Rickettsiaceae bacterium]